MRLAAAFALLATTSGCSFFLTKGPGKVAAGTDPKKVDCTEHGLVPALDAIAGAGGVAVAFGGTLVEYVSEDHEPHNFKYYYALPSLLVGIVYLYAAGEGTERVGDCQKVKENAEDPNTWQVEPIDMGQKKDKEKPPDIEDITP